MSRLVLALVLLSQEGPATLDSGLTAFREGRYEEAARLLGEALASAPTYEGLVTLGLARGRLERLPEAGEAFDRAIVLDPRRPEAWVERGGLRFLEKRYEDAVVDLEKALGLREDAYTRDMLASSLHLAGRSEDALAHWNALGQPVLGSLEITGLAHTRDRVARRELGLSEGDLLRLDRVRESRLRLGEVGVFGRITLRPIPRGGGKADLEVALEERHGLYGALSDFVVSTGVNLTARRLRLRYSNVGGSGVTFGGQYRWQKTRPEISLLLNWPRPFGLPAYLRAQSFRGRQVYELDGDSFVRRSRGLDLSLRRVLGARTVGALGLRARDRSFSRPRADAPLGALVGLEMDIERRLVDRRRHRADASLSLFRATGRLGSTIAYPRGLLTLGYRAFLSPPEGISFEKSVLAAQVRWGWGGSRMPLDEMFAPGGSLEMEFPLRAHHQTSDGKLGETPLGRSLALTNIEWRRRFLDSAGTQMGVVLFYDGARISSTAAGSTRTLHDVGGGLRLGAAAGTILRFDYGHGLSDGNNAFFAGINQAF